MIKYFYEKTEIQDDSDDYKRYNDNKESVKTNEMLRLDGQEQAGIE